MPVREPSPARAERSAPSMAAVAARGAGIANDAEDDVREDVRDVPDVEEEDLEFDPSSLDFSDIERRYAVHAPTGFDNVVVVDNVPVIDSAKYEKLMKAVRKVFSDIGRIRPDGIHLPKDESTGMTKGFAFIEFETPEEAKLAILNGNGYRFDKKHVFTVTRFDDIETYTNLADEFVAPVEEEYVPKEHLRSWLTDERARDQWVMLKGEEIGIYWNNKAERPDRDTARMNWSDSYVMWSPLGTYLVTFHNQGVALWGGPSWKKIVRFTHPHVKLVEFSPNEKYLVTWSHEPFMSPEGQKHQIAVWDIETGQQLRTFAVEASTTSTQVDQRSAPGGTVKVDWPIFKWSYDGKYLAKMTPGEQGAISVYETPSMGLLDKKSIKVENLVSFDWSPKDHLISYWTPEIGNIPARVTLMKIPTREIVRTKNLFNVLDCKLVWQNAGDFLLVRVDRAKSKKQTITSFEVFRMREKDIPVDVHEINLNEEVTSITWEPKGNRFVVLSVDGPKSVATFYQVEQVAAAGAAAPASAAAVGMRLLKAVDAKGINQVVWSPNGRFCVLAGVRGLQGDLQFWDAEDMTVLGTGEHYACTDIEWDPTGRYIVTSISGWRVSNDTGFIMWTFAGQQIVKQNITGFKQMLWRPRPPTLLSAQEQKNIKKNLKNYSREFDNEDLDESSRAQRELIEKRRALWREWVFYTQKAHENYEAGLPERIAIYGFDPDALEGDACVLEELEEWVEEVVEETDEIID